MGWQRGVLLLDVAVVLTYEVDGESARIEVILRREDLALVAHDDFGALQGCPYGLEVPVEEDKAGMVWWGRTLTQFRQSHCSVRAVC